MRIPGSAAFLACAVLVLSGCPAMPMSVQEYVDKGNGYSGSAVLEGKIGACGSRLEVKETDGHILNKVGLVDDTGRVCIYYHPKRVERNPKKGETVKVEVGRIEVGSSFGGGNAGSAVVVRKLSFVEE